jgi:flagellar biosynthesis/type III secretory pathway M-ring protein FliF/YscJ
VGAGGFGPGCVYVFFVVLGGVVVWLVFEVVFVVVVVVVAVEVEEEEEEEEEDEEKDAEEEEKDAEEEEEEEEDEEDNTLKYRKWSNLLARRLANMVAAALWMSAATPLSLKWRRPRCLV